MNSEENGMKWIIGIIYE